METVVLFWFRRDLRLHDNTGLYHALISGYKVIPLFIFDKEILNTLSNPADARVSFIYQEVSRLKNKLAEMKCELVVRFGSVVDIFSDLAQNYKISAVYVNEDYEPSAIQRDIRIRSLMESFKAEFKSFKDHCLFHKDEILSSTGKPYTVFTPYKKNVLNRIKLGSLDSYPSEKFLDALHKSEPFSAMIPLSSLSFTPSHYMFPSKNISIETLKKYEQDRNFPGINHGTTHIGIHLRFGTVSIRECARNALGVSEVWLSELIWRDFFMQILWHFPHVVNASFKRKFDDLQWRDANDDWEKWQTGNTGFPLVDAGMRELNQTGYMHNRVRMVTASFLCKHLFIHWSKGERYFAKTLLDYELASNNGNWQWVAGTGCDAAPYFRIFNPLAQEKKFDPMRQYIKRWVPEVDTAKYIRPMVAHEQARARCLLSFKGLLR